MIEATAKTRVRQGRQFRSLHSNGGCDAGCIFEHGRIHSPSYQIALLSSALKTTIKRISDQTRPRSLPLCLYDSILAADTVYSAREMVLGLLFSLCHRRISGHIMLARSTKPSIVVRRWQPTLGMAPERRSLLGLLSSLCHNGISSRIVLARSAFLSMYATKPPADTTLTAPLTLMNATFAVLNSPILIPACSAQTCTKVDRTHLPYNGRRTETIHPICLR